MYKYVKIANIQTSFGRLDYKGLDIDKVVPGGVAYSKSGTECMFVVEEDTEIPVHPDITEVTEEEFMAYRQVIINEQQDGIVSTEQRISDLETAFASLYGM